MPISHRGVPRSNENKIRLQGCYLGVWENWGTIGGSSARSGFTIGNLDMNFTTVSCQYCGRPCRVWNGKNMNSYSFCSPICKKAYVVRGAPRRKKKKTKRGSQKSELPKTANRKFSPEEIKKVAQSDRNVNFYLSTAWKIVRYEVLLDRGGKCEACGASPKTGAVLHVDHIKPRYRFPKLELERSNLQVLCADCNKGKGAWDETDWRKKHE